jgi:hypothetical protein
MKWGSDVDDQTLLLHLEALADALGVEVRHEPLEDEAAFCPGGLCRIGDRKLLILNTLAPLGQRLTIMAGALKRFNLGTVYVKPALREFLEGAKNR